jgi:hypothetical protein
MMKEIVYIAGPYRARTIFGVIWNIIRAYLVAVKYWQKGHVCICPHMNSALMNYFRGLNDDNIWLKGDLDILARCDKIVMSGDWLKSSGSRAELDYAIKYRLKVIYDD